VTQVDSAATGAASGGEDDGSGSRDSAASGPGWWDRLAGLMQRRALLVVGLWVALAAGLNLAVPQLEHVVAERSAAFIPDSAPSLVALSRMGAAFGESGSTSIGYLVFEHTGGLTDADRRYATRLLAELAAHRDDVESVQDLAADPATAPIAVSADGQASYAVVRLHGGLGSAQARHGQAAVADAVARPGAPPGLGVHLTGPAPTVGDELATEDHTVLLITALSVVMIVVLLLLVYRSPITIVVPLASVGLALAVARPVVAVLGLHAGLDVSIFSVMLLAALILGGGTDYAIFLLHGYHAARRAGRTGDDAITESVRRTGPVVVASGATVAASCAVMALTKVVLFRTAGLACSLGMLVAVASSLTLVPALIALLLRRGHLEPREHPASAARWARVGALVARRPVAALAASAALLLLLAAQVPRMSTGYDERAMQPASTASNQGYAAIGRHFDPNELTPDYIVIDADHDLRNAPDFAALNAASRAAATVPGVRTVRSVTQPRGTTIDEFTLAGQDRILAGRLDEAIGALRAGQPQLDQLRDGAVRLDDGVRRIDGGAGAATGGSGQISRGADALRDGLATASRSSGQLADGADQLASGAKRLADGVDAAVTPLFDLLNSVSPPGPCPQGSCAPAELDVLAADPSLLGRIRFQLSQLKSGSRQLADGNGQLATGAHQLRDGLADAATGSTTLASGQALLTTKLAELARGTRAARDGTDRLSVGVGQVGPQLRQLLDGLTQARDVLAASGTASGTDAGFFVPAAAFTDPRLAPDAKYFLSADGRSARLMIVNRDSAYAPDAPGRIGAVVTAVRGALGGTSLHTATVSPTGLAAGFADLHRLVTRDLAVIAASALAFIALILAMLLRAVLAPLYMLVTIVVSYAAALGLTVLIWQDLLGIDVYWAVPALAFIALVAVGSDYNIMVMSRIREEATGDVRAGVARAVASTGGVVSTAGVVFAVTMLAMLASPTTSIGQVGSTIGAGLLLDTFVVRTLTVPALAVLFGDASWWPFGRRGGRPALSGRWRTGRA
jgi:RND superfamily putative drug exporter